MSYLFDYKINKDNKCGFPESVFNKVINTLEDKKISYEVIFKDKNSLLKKYNRLNNYDKYLKMSIGFQDIKGENR